MKHKKFITSDDILGKKAIGEFGKIIGQVKQLHINKRSKQIVGITIDQGFSKPDIFLGINNVREFSSGDVIFLKKTPLFAFIGLKVFSSTGEIVGAVQDVEVDSKDEIEGIIIKKKSSLPFFGKKVLVTVDHIKEKGKAIILKEDFTYVKATSSKNK